MADFTDNKDGPTLSPMGAVDSSWNRLEPLVTAAQLRDTHLLWLPLVSGMTDPNTGKRIVATDDQINGIIIQAVTLAEAETGLQIFPTQHQEKLAFDRFEFNSMGYFKLKNRPVSSIQALQVVPANGIAIYNVPLDWIETANMGMGQINLIPINIAATGIGTTYAPPAQTGGGAFFLSVLGQQAWVPAFWLATYTTGFPDGKIPRMVNQYIGTIAAIELLSQLAATYAKSTSHSQSLDGVSQSISTPGPTLYQTRITDLTEKRKMLKGKLLANFGLKMFSGNV